MGWSSGGRGGGAAGLVAVVAVSGAAVAPVSSPELRSEAKAVRSAVVYEEASFGARQVGLIEAGATFRLAPPDGGPRAPEGWVAIEGGYLRSAAASTDTDGGTSEGPDAFWYGKVTAAAAEVRAQPSRNSVLLENQPADRVLAFVPNPELFARKWLQRPHGGFMQTRGIRLEHASAFAGEWSPNGTTVFVIRPTQARVDGLPVQLPKFWRSPLVSASGDAVVTAGGTLPRRSVRLAWAVDRHASIPAGAKWVHIDLKEQALTAYEGERLVFATLVSAGKRDHPTHPGLYRVWLKGLHELMHAPDEYFVEEVPFVLYFHRGQGLHGAFWHGQFGTPVSHGCVNLSVTDARALFWWAPPELPTGWHTRLPGPTEEALWVWVEDGPPRPQRSALAMRSAAVP